MLRIKSISYSSLQSTLAIVSMPSPPLHLHSTYVYNFARRKPRIEDPQRILNEQRGNFLHAYKKYKHPDEFKHEDILFEQELYGNKCEISGITRNNYESSIFTQHVIGLSKPKTIILGGMNETQAMYSLKYPTYQPSVFTSTSWENNLKPSKLYCKSTLMPILHTTLETQNNWFYEQKEKLLWYINRQERLLQLNDYLNAAYNVTFNDAKLIYGKPHSLYIFEDLILTMSVEKLQEILDKTLSKIEDVFTESYQWQPTIIMEHIKKYAESMYPELYSKEITYTTCLLNRLTKIEGRNLLLIEKEYVNRIAQNVHDIGETVGQPEKIFRGWMHKDSGINMEGDSENQSKLGEILSLKKKKEVLRKFVLLSILKGFYLQRQLLQGKNFFKHSIFAELFERDNFSSKSTAMEFHKAYIGPIKRQYMERIFEIQTRRLKNITTHYHPQTQFMFLEDQFSKLQERNVQFEQYDQFEAKNYFTENEKNRKSLLLEEKLKELVESECDEHEKMMYQHLTQGRINKEVIIFYSKLLGRANVQLGEGNRLKLPFFHFNAFRGFYKEYMRDYLLEDKQQRQDRSDFKRAKKLQQKFQSVTKQIKDPQLLRKYISGEMGPCRSIDMITDQNGNVDFRGEIEEMGKMLFDEDGLLTDEMPEEMKTEMKEMLKKIEVEKKAEQKEWEEGKGEEY